MRLPPTRFGWGAIIALNIYLPIYLQDVLAMTATERRPEPDDSDGRSQHQRGRNQRRMIGRQTRYKIVPLIGLGSAAIAVAVLAW